MFHVKKTFRSPCMSSYVDTSPTPVKAVVPVIPVIDLVKVLNKKPKFLPGERLLKEVGVKLHETPAPRSPELDMFKKSITEVIKRLR